MTVVLAMPSFGIDCCNNIYQVPNAEIAVSGLKVN